MPGGQRLPRRVGRDGRPSPERAEASCHSSAARDEWAFFNFASDCDRAEVSEIVDSARARKRRHDCSPDSACSPAAGTDWRVG